MRAAAWLVVGGLLGSCVSMQPTPQPGSCGLVLGEPVVRRRPPPPRTDLYLGLVGLAGGLMSLGVAAGYGVMASDHRDEADHGGRVRSLLLDKADAAFWSALDGEEAGDMSDSKVVLARAKLVVADRGLIDKAFRGAAMLSRQQRRGRGFALLGKLAR